MAVSEKVTSPGNGGGLAHLKWEPNPLDKSELIASDGAKREPARIRVRTQMWLGKTTDVHFVYRNNEYLGSTQDLAEAKKLAASGERKETALTDTIDGTPDGLRAFLSLTTAERKASKDAYWEMRYQDGKLQPRQSYMSKYDSMSAEQLVGEYNHLVEVARGAGLDRFRPVHRFQDKAEGLRFIEVIESAIRARQASEKAVKQEAGKKSGPIPTEVKPAPKKKAEPPTTKEDETMATTNGKSGAKKSAKKAAKKAAPKKAAKKAAGTTKGPKVYERPAGKVGEFTGKLNTRPGTNRDKLAVFMFQNLGKMVDLADVCKAVYGKKEVVAAVTNVINGFKNDIEAAKVAYNVKREDKSIGLFTGSK